MNGDTISLEDEELQALGQLVAEALERGDSRESVLADLANNGIPEDDAENLVASVEFQMYQVDTGPSDHSQSGSGGGMGWLIWIAVIVGFKIISALLK